MTQVGPPIAPAQPSRGDEGGHLFKLPAKGWSAGQIFTLGFLTLVATFNYLDRSLLGLALPQIKREMHLSDTVLGLVTGLAFALFYALMGVPIARLADRASRRTIIAAGFFFWSLMAAATGYVANVWQLAAARFLMGAGEACGVPPSTSMIGDVFAAKHRPSALAVLGTGVSISAIVFYPAASWIAEHHGWRTMFHVFGLAGMLLAIIFFLTVREPVRGAFDANAPVGAPASVGATLRFLAGQKTYLLLLLATIFQGAQISGESAWNATFLTRVHHMPLSEVGLTLGTVRGIIATVGILACGFATDWLGRRDPRWRLWAPAAIGVVFAPAKALFLMSDSWPVWFGAFCVASFFSYGAQSAVLAAILSIARLRMRAFAIALMMLCSNLLSQAVGPFLIGLLSDALRPVFGEDSIRYAMLTIIVCIVGTSLALYGAARFYSADVARARSEG